MLGSALALCSATAIAAFGDTAPAWLHLLPAGEIKSRDGRGPYRVTNPSALAAASLAQAGGKMILCDNHATDLAAPLGQPAPARGWITELQVRTDGIWGRVDWTPEGRRLVETRAYRAVSPVIAHRKDGTITGLLRASLVNQPNLVGLTSLHASGARKMDDIDHAIAAFLGIDLPKYQSLLAGSAEFRDKIEPLRRDFEKRVVALQRAEGSVQLGKADYAIIAMMGLDPTSYRQNLSARGHDISAHCFNSMDAADQSVIRLMDLDPAQYLKTSAAGSLSKL